MYHSKVISFCPDCPSFAVVVVVVLCLQQWSREGSDSECFGCHSWYWYSWVQFLLWPWAVFVLGRHADSTSLLPTGPTSYHLGFLTSWVYWLICFVSLKLSIKNTQKKKVTKCQKHLIINSYSSRTRWIWADIYNQRGRRPRWLLSAHIRQVREE